MKLNLCKWQIERLKQTGLTLSDSISIKGVYQKKRQLKLLRQSYLFTNCSSLKEKKPWIINLESFQNESFNVVMEWVPLFKPELDGVFVIRSTKGGLLKVNGTFVTEAIVERGDLIEFGLNSIQALVPLKDRKEFSLEPTLFHEAAKSSLPVLIEGETGTGKTRLARQIHEKSKQAGRFIHLNLSSFSPNLLESELFGHLKGSFTGAVNDKQGAFGTAKDGTLFLDEIDSLSKELQVKLLLFLDSGHYRPVGSNLDKKLQTRIIFASGSFLDELVKTKRMRSDFYFRLKSGFRFQLPALRDQKELIEVFINKYLEEKNLMIDKQLLEFYKNQVWPGNYRELKAHLNLKSDLSKGRKLFFGDVDQSLMSQWVCENKQHPILPLGKIKSDYMRFVHEQVKGDIKLGAELLQISPATLRMAIRKGA